MIIKQEERNVLTILFERPEKLWIFGGIFGITLIQSRIERMVHIQSWTVRFDRLLADYMINKLESANQGDSPNLVESALMESSVDREERPTYSRSHRSH